MFRQVFARQSVRYNSSNAKFMEDVFNKLKSIKEISKEPNTKQASGSRPWSGKKNPRKNNNNNNRQRSNRNRGKVAREGNTANAPAALNTVGNYQAQQKKTFSPELDSVIDSASQQAPSNQKFTRKSFSSRRGPRPVTSRIDRVIQRARRGRMAQEDATDADFLNKTADRGAYTPASVTSDSIVLTAPGIPYSHETRVLRAMIELLKEKNIPLGSIERASYLSLLPAFHNSLGEPIDDLEISEKEITDKLNAIVLGKTEFFQADATKLVNEKLQLNATVVRNASNSWNASTNEEDIRDLVAPALVGEQPVGTIPKPFME
ncbi:unnamed protein product [Kuraishia capsulata CBS 1993]|uniref:Uncharacterized protein n=1 Tax=Kuraishia capsulata CBS 1993 TaxID=1382522 RepID=W6MRQ7_9ASCO|nr:uncharacterized protein KUCA_T00005024001 [Kuraishia capsulata CBS 1993]CDK29038.1 unnamed protein product [Kuraishia capsulata CBS 1993]